MIYRLGIVFAIIAALVGILLGVVAFNPDLLHERPLNAFTFRWVKWAYPTAPVPRSTSVFDLRPQESAFAFNYKFRGETYAYRDFLDRTFTTSIVITRENQILAEDYFYLSNHKSQFLGQSLTKSITSVLTGIALDQGLIKSLDQVVVDYIPTMKDTAFAQVPIRDLLNMTSGVEALEDWTNPESTITRFADAILSLDEHVLDVIRSQKNVAPPGTRFNYATTDVQVLGWILESASGQTLAEFNAQNLWQPMGAESDAYYYLTFAEPQTAIAGGSFNATTRDYARFGILAMNQGLIDGRRVVSKDWLQIAPDHAIRQVGQLGAVYPPLMGYHKLWWVLDNDGQQFCAWGVYGQFICIDRKTRLVMAKTSAFPSADSPVHEEETIAFFMQLSSTMETRP